MTDTASNWKNVKTVPKTIFDMWNKKFMMNPHALPSLDQFTDIIIGSDYSGESNDEPYRVYSFLITGDSAFSSWDSKRAQLRKKIFPDGRRMSYKKLGDKYRFRYLMPFLKEADEMDGLLVSLAISKSAPPILPSPPLDLSNASFNEFKGWKQSALEKAFILLNVSGFLLAGLCRTGQNIFWFTDEDQIAANQDMLISLTNAFSWVASGYLDFDLGHLRCGTTACDKGNLQIEDFVSVADLVAGALSEQFRGSISKGTRDEKILWLSGDHMKDKAEFILFWMGTSQKKLKKHVFVIDSTSDELGHKLSWFNFGEGNINTE